LKAKRQTKQNYVISSLALSRSDTVDSTSESSQPYV